MKRSPALRVLAVALGAALSLTACARPVATTDAGAPPLAEAGGAVLPSNHGCPTPDHGTPLPADAVLVSVDRCRSEIRAVPGDGQWEFRIDERATTNLAPLAAALRRPSEPIGAHTVCDLVLHDQPVITVRDQLGRQITPTVPQTACRAPLPAVVQALDNLVWVPFATTKLGQVQTELEVTSGCPGGYKQMVALEASMDRGEVARPEPVPTTAAHLRVCRYDLDPSSVVVTNIHGGDLVAASTLDGSAARALLTAVADARPVTGICAHPESSFVVVSPPDGRAPNITIELTGCYRAWVDSENYLRQLDAATVHSLLAP
jgi:hypothetical protein